MYSRIGKSWYAWEFLWRTSTLLMKEWTWRENVQRIYRGLLCHVRKWICEFEIIIILGNPSLWEKIENLDSKCEPFVDLLKTDTKYRWAVSIEKVPKRNLFSSAWILGNECMLSLNCNFLRCVLNCLFARSSGMRCPKTDYRQEAIDEQCPCHYAEAQSFPFF